MANPELVEVTLDEHGFSFYVVKLPPEAVEDKLALNSPETGLICRMEYQNFLYCELVVNLERMYRFIAENTGGDQAEQIKIREEVEREIYKVNPKLDPSGLIITKSGVIKPAGKGEGEPLVESADWDRILDDLNPFIIFEEVDILEQIPPLLGAEGDDNEGPPFLDSFDTVELKWERTNIVLNIRKFSPDDLPFIFGPEVSFREELHYKIHIIQKCVDKADSVFALCDAMGITQEVQIPTLAAELYLMCIEVNPFLKAEDVDLDDIRSKSRKNKKRRKVPESKSKRGSGKKFADITHKELLTLAERMNKRIVGQPEAVEKIVDTIQISSCGLKNPESPVAVYLMCGTTGVGKTLTAKVLAEELCGSRDNMVRIDCSEYTQQHDIQKLISAPPSYVGYEDGGFLTNAVQSNPFSIVLFDEIEKAHNKLFDLLLQIMDDARLTDGKGTVTDFKECIILLTSNIGVNESEAVKSTMGFGDAGLLTNDRREEALKSALKTRFRPEFLNRIDETLSFRSLTKDDALHIVDLLLELVKGYLENKKIVAEFTDSVRDMIFDKGFSKKFGARPLQRAIDKEIVRALAKKFLRGEVLENTRIKVDYKNDKLVVRNLKSRAARKKTTIVKGG